MFPLRVDAKSLTNKRPISHLGLMDEIDRQLKIITRGCDELIVEAELRDKIEPGGPARDSVWTDGARSASGARS
jgi:hypothetical protein